jgi:hypothetical protein
VKHPDWTGRTAVVIANGPSLTAEQIVHVEASTAWSIGVNTAYMMTQHCDVYYAGDYLFWSVHSRRMIAKFPRATQQFWTCDATASEQFGINRWKGRNEPGLGEALIHLNGNSGAQARLIARDRRQEALPRRP